MWKEYTMIKTYLIIDGYNIINQWADLKEIAKKSLEDARMKLLAEIQGYAKLKSYYFIIVFDAYNINDKIKQEVFENGSVIFTQKNQTADSYIEKLVYDMPKVYEIYVVTSDFTLQRMIIGSGATRITALELEKDVKFAKRRSMKKTEEQYNMERNNLEKSLDVNTMKKLDKIRRGQLE